MHRSPKRTLTVVVAAALLSASACGESEAPTAAEDKAMAERIVLTSAGLPGFTPEPDEADNDDSGGSFKGCVKDNPLLTADNAHEPHQSRPLRVGEGRRTGERQGAEHPRHRPAAHRPGHHRGRSVQHLGAATAAFTRFRDPSGVALEHPAAWTVEPSAGTDPLVVYLDPATGVRDLGSGDLRFLAVWTVRDAKAWPVTFASDPARYNASLPEIERLLTTIQLPA